jgi:hypothetical protein
LDPNCDSDIKITEAIPINSDTCSSSSLVVI